MEWKKRAAEIERLRRTTPRWKNALPDLTVDSRTAPTSDRITTTMGRKDLPADARQFPVGNSHKQGPMLITEGMMSDLAHLGGKKT